MSTNSIRPAVTVGHLVSPGRTSTTLLVTSALALLLGGVPAAATNIDFENAPGNDNDLLIVANGGNIYAGLDWSNAGDLSGASDWEVNTDNLPYPSFGGGNISLQGFAEGDNNRAKVGWDGTNSFEFVSMALRTRFDTDNGGIGFVNTNADIVDDRFLTSITVTVRDINNDESLAVIDLLAAGDWVTLSAAMLAGTADVTQLKAIFFTGDSGTAVAGFKNDRFSIDNLTVKIVPEPGTGLLATFGLVTMAMAARRRRAT